MLESKYQNKLIKKIQDLIPSCLIIKNDPTYTQGFPDLTIFFEDRWAVLEVKASEDSPQQPNQEYYINFLNRMSFASFIYPENEREVLYHLQQTFGLIR